MELSGRGDRAVGGPHLGSQSALVQVPAETVLFRAADVAATCFVVESGALLRSDGRTASETRLRLVLPGQLAGEGAVVGDRTYGFCVRTLSDCRLRVWSAAELRALGPSTEHARLVSLVARQLRAEIVELERAPTETVATRLARILGRLASALGDGPDERICHGLTQSELARLVGANRASVNRALASMSRAGSITCGNGWVVVHDPGLAAPCLIA